MNEGLILKGLKKRERKMILNELADVLEKESIKIVEREIKILVDRYARVMERAGGDCAETKRLEGEIDGLEIALKKLKGEWK